MTAESEPRERSNGCWRLSRRRKCALRSTDSRVLLRPHVLIPWNLSSIRAHWIVELMSLMLLYLDISPAWCVLFFWFFHIFGEYRLGFGKSFSSDIGTSPPFPHRSLIFLCCGWHFRWGVWLFSLSTVNGSKWSFFPDKNDLTPRHGVTVRIDFCASVALLLRWWQQCEKYNLSPFVV